jgi:hypothetical protein
LQLLATATPANIASAREAIEIFMVAFRRVGARLGVQKCADGRYTRKVEE